MLLTIKYLINSLSVFSYFLVKSTYNPNDMYSNLLKLKKYHQTKRNVQENPFLLTHKIQVLWQDKI